MIAIVLALLFGLAIALLIWSVRGALRARWQADVAWLEHSIWRLTPAPFDAAPYVTAYYAVAVGGLVACIFLPFKVLDLIVWAAIIVVPKLLIDHAWSKRRRTIDEQLPAAVLQMSSSVGSGMSLVQAIERLAGQAPAPIKTEFGLMANYWNMGADFEATIEEARRRLRLANFDLFSSAILINQRMGGNVSDTLDRLAHSLESVEHMRREVHAATSEGRTNVRVLSAVPFIMLGFVSLMDFEAVKMLFTEPFGQLLLAIAAAFSGAGIFWAWRIVNADV